MFILWRRYSRSGFAPWWLYGLLAIGFIGMGVWALITGAWLVAGISFAMLPVVLAAIALTRKLNEAPDAPRRAGGKDGHHE